MATESEVRAVVKRKLLASIDDLREQAEEDQIHALAYVAVHESGRNVVATVTNGVLRPVTLLGAISILTHRVIELIQSGESTEYTPKEPETDDTTN